MKLKIGDTVLVKKCIGRYFSATIIIRKKDIFGIYYLASWNVRDFDFGIEYKKIGKLRKHNIKAKYENNNKSRANN